MLYLKISSIEISHVILCSCLIKHNFILFKNLIIELFLKFQVIYRFDYNTPCSRINIASVNTYETFRILLVASSKFYSCKQRGVTFAVVVEVKNKYCLVLLDQHEAVLRHFGRRLLAAVERTCHYLQSLSSIRN